MYTNVDLGFLQPTDEKNLHSRFFPSKVGAKPSWLALENLPTIDRLICSNCEIPTVFLAQIYAPIDNLDDAFHRTIYIFICRNSTCASQEVKAFRSQLPKLNKFYPSTPPDENAENFNVNSMVQLCSVCGNCGPKQCAACKTVRYCSRSHQIIDWKSGHKQNCKNNVTFDSAMASKKILFEEFGLVMEAEEMEDEKKSSAENLAEYQKLVNQGKAGTLAEIDDKELQECVEIKDDKIFSKFKKRIDLYPDQVVRYERCGEPLWISKMKPDDIPNCEYCGSKRQFEFQILPQILFELNENNIDFGTLIIYTCLKSCSEITNEDSVYKNEYVFKQLVD